MTEKRKPIPKKIRFEVFKRDRFTCQYCGRKSPDVVLEVDHINPVSKGGTNDILNLITSCFDCNRGKGKVELSDDSAVEKQRLQMELLENRREQVQMIIKWRRELRNERKEEMEAIVEIIEEESGLILTDYAKGKILKCVHQFDFETLCDAAEIACNQYIRYDNPTSVSLALSKLGGICYNLKKQRGEENGDRMD